MFLHWINGVTQHHTDQLLLLTIYLTFWQKMLNMIEHIKSHYSFQNWLKSFITIHYLYSLPVLHIFSYQCQIPSVQEIVALEIICHEFVQNLSLDSRLGSPSNKALKDYGYILCSRLHSFEAALDMYWPSANNPK